MRYAFWQNHAIVDAAIGTFIEYGTTNRDKDKESYAEMWHRWIYEDYYWVTTTLSRSCLRWSAPGCAFC